MFVGTYEHSLDDKGRVVLPSSFRARLSDGGFITPFGDYLGLWTVEGFEEVAAMLTERVRKGKAPQEARRAFAANAHEVRVDSQGRISIPQRLRDVAGLTRDLAIIGDVDRVEVWDAQKYWESHPHAESCLSKAVEALRL